MKAATIVPKVLLTGCCRSCAETGAGPDPGRFLLQTGLVTDSHGAAILAAANGLFLAQLGPLLGGTLGGWQPKQLMTLIDPYRSSIRFVG